MYAERFPDPSDVWECDEDDLDRLEAEINANEDAIIADCRAIINDHIEDPPEGIYEAESVMLSHLQEVVKHQQFLQELFEE